MTVSRGRFGWAVSGVKSMYWPKSREETDSKGEGRSGAEGEEGVARGIVVGIEDVRACPRVSVGGVK